MKRRRESFLKILDTKRLVAPFVAWGFRLVEPDKRRPVNAGR
jgi:hypothetical protein